jgi:hypothetical protein
VRPNRASSSADAAGPNAGIEIEVKTVRVFGPGTELPLRTTLLPAGSLAKRLMAQTPNGLSLGNVAVFW